MEMGGSWNLKTTWHTHTHAPHTRTHTHTHTHTCTHTHTTHTHTHTHTHMHTMHVSVPHCHDANAQVGLSTVEDIVSLVVRRVKYFSISLYIMIIHY